MVVSGKHLSAVRSWIQRKVVGGDRVTWGSNEQLNVLFTVASLEILAQEIRDAVLREFGISPKQAEEKKYKIFCESGVAAFQFADSFRGIWSRIRKSTGKICIFDLEKNVCIFDGTTEEVISWLRGKK
jgi:hypothetical protein